MQEKIDVVLPPMGKAAVTWAGVFTGTWLDNFGIHTWADMSYAAATFVSLLWAFDWFWKRFWRGKFVEWGWLKPQKRRQSDIEEDDHDRD